MRWNLISSHLLIYYNNNINNLPETDNKNLETANIIWGMGDDNDNADNISILIILGYGK